MIGKLKDVLLNSNGNYTLMFEVENYSSKIQANSLEKEATM